MTRQSTQIQVPPLFVGSALLFIVVVSLGLSVVFTGITVVKPGEVAIIKNNVTGAETLKLTNGTIIHMPFGLTQVYRLDKTQQPVRMTQNPNIGDRMGDDSVQIKTNDGSNVNMDVEVQYQIMAERVGHIVKEVGRRDKYKEGLVRAYARSIIRDELGKLSVTEIADPGNRNLRLDRAKNMLNKQLEKYGLKTILITATNPSFNGDYERMIKDRKEADQDVRNEKSAQETALQEQKRKEAEQERIKSVTIREERGKQEALKIAAAADATKRVRESEGTSYAIKKQGDEAFIAASNEAKAIEVEGLSKALGIQALADAYKKGGIALVREALAIKFKGVRLEGQPYSLSSQIERFQLEKAVANSAK